MTQDTTKTAAVAADELLFDDWSDAIEDDVRTRVAVTPAISSK